MPQARDRRAIPADVAAIYARRRASILGVLHDDLDPLIFGSTPRPVHTSGSGPTRGGLGTPRNGIGRGLGLARSLHGSPALGAENSPLVTARRGRGRASTRRTPLPSWYPRTPLRDITAIVRAIERRRARLGENEGQQTGNHLTADQLLPDPSVSASDAHVEHGASVISPEKVAVKLRTPAGSKVPKIFLDFANPSEGESELTPQKKLLNSIDTVEKAVKQELQKLKRTPSAKKAEREKRVRTLMSMR